MELAQCSLGRQAPSSFFRQAGPHGGSVVPRRPRPGSTAAPCYRARTTLHSALSSSATRAEWGAQPGGWGLGAGPRGQARELWHHQSGASNMRCVPDWSATPLMRTQPVTGLGMTRRLTTALSSVVDSVLSTCISPHPRRPSYAGPARICRYFAWSIPYLGSKHVRGQARTARAADWSRIGRSLGQPGA